jgi:hypothetical protein
VISAQNSLKTHRAVSKFTEIIIRLLRNAANLEIISVKLEIIQWIFQLL